VRVIFISHLMVTMYICKIIKLFYFTKVKGVVRGVPW
jgi:hypothetical protein